MTVPDTWPRDILPMEVSELESPTGFFSVSLSGKVQAFDPDARGRKWTETYGGIALCQNEPATRTLLMLVQRAYSRKLPYLIQHLNYQTTQGLAEGAAVTVNGANQYGEYLTVSPLVGSLRAGDLINLADRTLVYQLVADAPSGSTQLRLDPLIVQGDSPPNGTAVQYMAPTFTARIISMNVPSLQIGRVLSSGWSITWRESP